MPPAPPQQSNQSDNATGLLWTIAGIFAVSFFIWMEFKSSLVHFYFTLKLYEIAVISLFTHNLDDVRTTIQTVDPGQVTIADVLLVGNAVGNYLRYPCIILVLALAVIVYFSNRTRLFTRIYSMKDLLVSEQVNWPQVSPVAKLNLVKTDIDKGPWAMAMTPMQFCKRFKLLDEFKRQPTEHMTRKERNRVEVTLKRGQSNKIFAMQLGPLFMGVNKLPRHTQALFAAFAARINNDAAGAFSLLKQLSASAANGKLNFSGVDALLKKHLSTKAVQTMMESHAYVLTVMAAMLAGAREDGVQASADFIWLKPIDRKLWYMLNNVGRQTAFTEVGGPFAHWQAEKEMGKKILVPMVEEATNALELALKDIIYIADEV